MKKKEAGKQDFVEGDGGGKEGGEREELSIVGVMGKQEDVCVF